MMILLSSLGSASQACIAFSRALAKQILSSAESTGSVLGKERLCSIFIPAYLARLKYDVSVAFNIVSLQYRADVVLFQCN